MYPEETQYLEVLCWTQKAYNDKKHVKEKKTRKGEKKREEKEEVPFFFPFFLQVRQEKSSF